MSIASMRAPTAADQLEASVIMSDAKGLEMEALLLPGAGRSQRQTGGSRLGLGRVTASREGLGYRQP